MKTTNANHFNIIITGGGMAGLSLAYYLNNSTLSNKKILIIDKEPKTKNDRTWCFWEKKESTFESIIYRKWQTVQFAGSNNKLRNLDIGNYHYKMLRGIDFYNFIYQNIKGNPNISFVYDTLISITDKGDIVDIKTENSSFTADYVFDSTKKLEIMEAFDTDFYKINQKQTLTKAKTNFLQHFKGIVIETNTPKFDPNLPLMMNFGIAQHDECRFMYVLPMAENKALIEFTLFTENQLTHEAYDAELSNYIKNKLEIEEYKVLETEFGVIPMTDEPTSEFPSARVVRIGTSAGATNPSTGYTFCNTQNRLQQLVNQLEKTGKPFIETSWFQKRHFLYASILLNVLRKKRFPAGEIFDLLYQRNPPALVFKFLDGETNFAEELKIMSSTPISHFLKAAIEVILHKKR